MSARRDRFSAVMRTAAAIAVGPILAGCQASLDPRGRTTYKSGSASFGASVVPVQATGPIQNQRVVHGHTVQVASSGSGFQIVVDGRVLATDNQDDRVVIRSVHEGGGRAYVLVEEQSGGTACPSMFQAVDLSAATPAVSPQFGNCSDLPRVSVVNGTLRLAVPAFRAASAKVYLFKGGRLRG